MVRLELRVVVVFSVVTVLTTLFLEFNHSGRATDLQGEKNIEYLLSRLESHSDFKVRIAAAEALGKVANGTVADWMLRAFRREENEAVRLATLYSVAQIPDHLILPPLLELVNQELLHEVEMIAVERMVWNFRRAVAISEWTKSLLASNDREERATSAYLLGLTGDASVLPALVTALSDPISHVRVRAVQAVGRIGSRFGRAYCERASRLDPDLTVKKAAETCVGEIDLIQKGTYPAENKRRTNLGNDLSELIPNSLTPNLMQKYLRKNVNPRQLDQAVSGLQKEEVEVRTDKTISLVRSQELRKTLRVNAEMTTAFQVNEVDLTRIKEVLKENAGPINVCYLTALKTNRKLAGDVTTRFLVLQSGEVSTVEILESTVPNRDVSNCIAEKIRALSFSKLPLKYVTIKYKFVFFPPKDSKYEF